MKKVLRDNGFKKTSDKLDYEYEERCQLDSELEFVKAFPKMTEAGLRFHLQISGKHKKLAQMVLDYNEKKKKGS